MKPVDVLPGWSTTEVAGHACDVFQQGPDGQSRFAVIYLHGVHRNRLVNNETFTALFAANKLVVLAPQGGSCWWTDRICPDFDDRLTPERYVVEQISGYVLDRWQIGSGQVALLGTSMGGQGALRISYKYPQRFPIVAALAPAIDYQIRWNEGDPILSAMYSDPESIRQDTATLQVHPLNWPRHQWFCCDPADARWYDSADRLRMKLVALGIPHQCDLTTSGGGHGFAYYDRMAGQAVGFLAAALEAESRRLA